MNDFVMSEPLRLYETTKQIIGTSYKKFGFGDSIATAGSLAVLAASRAALKLDDVFHPEYESIEVKSPIFIIGNPRSGTTFLHRLLTQTNEYPSFATWELIFPGVSSRKLIKPFLNIGVKAFSSTFNKKESLFSEEAHTTTLTSTEEEELLFLLNLDSQFLYLFTALGMADNFDFSMMKHDEAPLLTRDSSLKLFKSCLKRQIYKTGKQQIVAKMPYSIMRIRSLLAEFPDAKFIYIARSPIETISSHLSLHRNFFEQRYGLKNIDRDILEQYFSRRYKLNVELYKYFTEIYNEKDIPSDQLHVIRYPDLLTNLYAEIEKMTKGLNIELSTDLKNKILEQSQMQKRYNRTHVNEPLEHFGLSESKVHEDLREYMSLFGFQD